MKERRMKINRDKLEKLLAAVAPTIYDINEIPHIKDIPYGSCEWQDGKIECYQEMYQYRTQLGKSRQNISL